MSKITSHRRRAERTTASSPADVYATAADLTLFPRWWFARDPSEDEPDQTLPAPVRHVEEIDGRGTVAAPDLEIDVRTEELRGELLSRAVTIEPAMTRRVTCEVVEPDERLVLGHRVIDGGVTAGKPTAFILRTEVTIEPQGDGSRVGLTQESEVHGRGLMAATVRKAHDHADLEAAKVLERLLDLAEADRSEQER